MFYEYFKSNSQVFCATDSFFCYIPLIISGLIIFIPVLIVVTLFISRGVIILPLFYFFLAWGRCSCCYKEGYKAAFQWIQRYINSGI